MRRFRGLAGGFVAALVALSAVSGAVAQNGGEYLQGLNQPRYHRVESQTLGRPFHVFVRLPEGYEESAQRYPAVYLLDGGHTFPMLASYYRYLRFGEEVPDLIIVGISYGADSHEQGNFRSTDFTAPAPDREHYGGAARFQVFLERELLPMVEEKYRADASKRVIFGQSIGGQFVLYTAMTRPDLFWGHIASNPALHRNLQFFLDYEPAGDGGRTRLFVSDSELNGAEFREPASRWIARWENAEDRPFDLKSADFAGETHFSAAPAAFRAGLKWLFVDGGD